MCQFIALREILNEMFWWRHRNGSFGVERRKLLELGEIVLVSRLFISGGGQTVADLAACRVDSICVKRSLAGVTWSGEVECGGVDAVRGNNQSGQATKGVWGMSWCQEA